jgi:hypothetical protein
MFLYRDAMKEEKIYFVQIDDVRTRKLIQRQYKPASNCFLALCAAHVRASCLCFIVIVFVLYLPRPCCFPTAAATAIVLLGVCFLVLLLSRSASQLQTFTGLHSTCTAFTSDPTIQRVFFPFFQKAESFLVKIQRKTSPSSSRQGIERLARFFPRPKNPLFFKGKLEAAF